MPQQVSIERDKLMSILQPVSGIVEKRQTLPILSNVLFVVKKNLLSVTATDLETQLTGCVPLIGCDEDFNITIPARKLIDICRGLPDGVIIEFFFENQKVTIKSDRSRYTLATLPADEYPAVEDGPNSVEFAIKQRDLQGLIHRTAFAMAQQDVRYYLNGICLYVSSSEIVSVATDGHRLAMNKVSIESNIPQPIQVILPRKGVLELMRLLDDSTENVAITIGQSHFRMETDSYIFTSKLLDGRFPDYKRVIPISPDKHIIIERDIFKDALNRASILCNEKFKGIRFDVANDLLTMTASNTVHEEAREELEISYDAEPIEIGFNVKYLLDVIQVLPGKVRLSFTDANSSILVTDADDVIDVAYVIMPMRL